MSTARSKGLPGVDIDAIHYQRGLVRQLGRAAIEPHHKGDAAAVDALLKAERRHIAKLRAMAPEHDLTVVHLQREKK